MVNPGQRTGLGETNNLVCTLRNIVGCAIGPNVCGGWKLFYASATLVSEPEKECVMVVERSAQRRSGERRGPDRRQRDDGPPGGVERRQSQRRMGDRRSVEDRRS